MRTHLIFIGKKILYWPHSKPHVLSLLHRLGLYTIAKKIYLYVRVPQTALSTEKLGHLEARVLMEQVQEILEQSDCSSSVIFLKNP